MDSATLTTTRTALGLTQAQLAAKLGVHGRTVSKWERGLHRIPQSVAALIELAINALESQGEVK